MSSEQQQRPWWTTEEKQQANRELQSLARAAAIINAKEPYLYERANWLCFKPEVLDKYRSNELCEVGDDYVSFLELEQQEEQNNDRKVPISTVNYANVQGIVLMVPAHEYFHTPPSERTHWEKYLRPVEFAASYQSRSKSTSQIQEGC
jgi:hypothetical protein